MTYFDPRGSREPRLMLRGSSTYDTKISIHEALANLDRNRGNLSLTYFLFRSTRLSRTSTMIEIDTYGQERISIHEALANLDKYPISGKVNYIPFRSTRLSRTSTHCFVRYRIGLNISIHEALANLDIPRGCRKGVQRISIHEALANLDRDTKSWPAGKVYFDPRGSREPRLHDDDSLSMDIHDFDPRGSREPRRKLHIHHGCVPDFDPRGSREPRQEIQRAIKDVMLFRSTRLSRTSTLPPSCKCCPSRISIHEALANLDPASRRIQPRPAISIHEALANLDSAVTSQRQKISKFRSTRLSRTSTDPVGQHCASGNISIHEALANLDTSLRLIFRVGNNHFDPRGSREPRPT